MAFRGPAELEMDDAASEGDNDGFSSIIGVKLLHHVLDVDLDRLFADVEGISDIAIAVAARDQLENLYFADREHVVGNILGQVRRYFAGNASLSRVDLPEGFDDFPRRHTLEQKSPGAGRKRTLNIDVALEG